MNLGMLDVAIGLVLLYLLLSLVCSAVLEGFQNFFNRRGLVLETQLLRLMGWRTLREFCSQPGFASLAARASSQPAAPQAAAASEVAPKNSVLARWRHFSRFPAYIPSDVFAELAVSWHERFHQGREWCDDHEFGRVMLRLGNECGTDRVRLQAKVAEWFDKTMQRASGRFKARTNLWFALIAVLLVIAANADTLRLATEMYRNPAIQQALVTQADALIGAQDTSADTGKEGAPEQAPSTEIKIASDDLRKAIQAFPLLGWPEDMSWWPAMWDAQRLLGYLITVFALMMGADFWFNALQKLIRIRTSLKPEEAKAAAPPAPAGGAEAAGAAPALTFALVGGARAAAPAVAPPKIEAPLPADLSARAPVFARISAFAYDRDGDLPVELTAAGYSAGPQFGDPRTGTQGVILEHAEYRVLAFRGTEPSEFADIQTDLKKELVAFPKAVLESRAVRVHQGFADGLASVWAPVTEALRSGDATKPLIVTGHSLGGALAVLAAYALRQQQVPFNVQGVYTYGQPRVGDGAFAEDYDRLLRVRHWRMVNHRDAVPRLPPRTMGFRHTGRVLYLGPDGKPSIDPSRWFQLLDLVPIDAGADWNSQVREFVADHAITAYINLLSAAD
jgi:triacylglycerol lipase